MSVMLEGEIYKSWDMKAVREELYNGRYKVFNKNGELKVELGVEEKGKCPMMVKWRSRRCEHLTERSQLRKIHDQPFSKLNRHTYELSPFLYMILASKQDALQNGYRHLRQYFATHLECISKSG
jgi:hypothetical protein